jgi:ribose/xylose/arabinose/galactoside ABC-type transport system permease subunit
LPTLDPRLRTLLSREPAAGAFVGFVAVFLFFVVAAPNTFLTHASFSSILSNQAVPGIAAIGITLLMISGEFDLSVGSILGVSSLVFLYSAVSGVPILLAGVLGVVAGCGLGLINGLLLVWTRIPSFIVTLGTMLVYRAIPLTAVSGGRIVRYADHSREDPTVAFPALILLLATSALCVIVIWIALPTLRDRRVKSRSAVITAGLASITAIYILLRSLDAYGLSPLATVEINIFHALNGRADLGLAGANYRTSILWWLGLTGVFAFILLHTRYGNAVLATGGNAEAARVQGIHIDRVRITNFVLSGGLAALAGIVQVARLKSVDPLRGDGLELEVIASVVIGGTLLTGGFGSVIGSAIGTALTGMLRTGLVLISIPSNAFRGAIGAIMIAAVIINTAVRRDR